jgi:hypothetical protein
MVKTSVNVDVDPGMVDVLQDLARELGEVDSDLRAHKLRESRVSTPWIARLMSEMGLVIDHAAAMELFRDKRDPPQSARSRNFRARLLRVSALALAGIEWCDRGGCPDQAT